MNGRLIVDNNVELDLSASIPVPTNYSIADSKEPNKRKRNYSKTVVLPGTQRNLDYFVSAYSLSMTTNNGVYIAGYDFDPTQRVKATYYKRAVPTFRGLMQLNEVSINDGVYSFEITLHSDFIEWFMSAGDTLISELGWSEYNHALTRTNISNSWATSIIQNGVAVPNFSAGLPLGFGYLYPLADYGYARQSPTTWRTYDMVPLVYTREVLIKSAEMFGLTIDSDWLDTPAMRSMVFGFGGGERAFISPTVASGRRIEFEGDYFRQDEVAYESFDNVSGATYKLFDQRSIIASPDFTVTTEIDPMAQYDATTGIITVAQSGLYSFSLSGVLSNIVTPNGMPLANEGGTIAVNVKKNGAIQPAFIGLVSSTDTSIDIGKSGELFLNTGDTVEITLVRKYIKRYSVSVSTDAVPIEITMQDTTDINFVFRAVNTTLTDGDTVEISRFLPEMKVSDYLQGMITGFNLYVSDPDENNVIRIEPMDDYYLPTNQFDDYTQIIDHSKPINIKPAASIEGKVYKFQFTDDADYDNELYRSRYGIGYGNRNYEVESTYQKNDRVFQLPFAQSVPVQITATNIVLPRIINFDEQTQEVKPYKGKPRMYFYNGLKPGAWRLTNIVNTSLYTNYTSYPCIHHFNNKDNPTFDFNWQLPEVLSYSATVVTTNNLFSAYHERFVRELTSKDSKIVELSVFYTADSISRLRFEKLKMWNGVLYRLNQVNDFDDDIADTTVIELVKVLEAKSPKKFGIVRPILSLGGLKSPIRKGGLSVDIDAPVIRGGVSASTNSRIIKG